MLNSQIDENLYYQDLILRDAVALIAVFSMGYFHEMPGMLIGASDAILWF